MIVSGLSGILEGLNTRATDKLSSIREENVSFETVTWMFRIERAE